MNPLNESTIEHHAIALFKELGYTYAFGPDNDIPKHAGVKNLTLTSLFWKLNPR